MAKKNGSKSKGNTSRTSAAKSAPVAKTETKAAAATTKPSGSAPKAQTVAKAPPVSSAPKKVITTEQIARRAYEIYASGKGGTEVENWHRAEQDLREGRA